MKGAIFLLKADGLVEMTEQDYESEDLLQEFLARYPALLAGDQMDSASPRRWLLISREASIPSEEGGSGRWSLDHLFLDQDGIPTLVEVKRSADTRIRREVVGQMLDYAANAILYWPAREIEGTFGARCEKMDLDADDELQRFLGEEQDPEAFWEKVKTNLKAEKIRLVFVADEIPPELRRIVEFLNSQMAPAEVLAVEIKQYSNGKLRTLVPRVIGRTAAAQASKGAAPRRQWDEPSFFEDLLARSGQADCTVARSIMQWVQDKRLDSGWGKGRTYGTYFPTVDHQGKSHRLFSIYTSGRIEFSFREYVLEADKKRRELLDRLNAIKGVNLAPEAITTWPAIAVSALHTDTELQQFLAAMDWVLADLETTGNHT